MFNEKDSASQQSSSYPDQKQANDPISRESFILEQALDPNSQNYAPLVPKDVSNIT